MNNELRGYLNNYILPQYKDNSNGHDLSHIQYVTNRSVAFANQINKQIDEGKLFGDKINLDMVEVIAAYHDLGHRIDAKTHEKISAEMLLDDKALKKWFTDSQILIMYDAVLEHRASVKKEPTNIYGKIVSSADRNTSIESILRRTYEYSRNLYPVATTDEIVEEAYRHVVEKFGENGYAVGKMYFDDKEYENFLQQVRVITASKNVFRCVFIAVNNLNKEGLKSQIESYSPWNEQESVDKGAMLKFIDTFADVVTRDNIFGHFTASAFVVNDSRTHALMLHHNIMGDYIYPGGHADGEYDLYSVALREVEEETGLKVEPMFGKEIFAIQAAPVKGHIKNSKYVPAHIHYDVLFVFKAKNEDMEKIRVLASENTSVEWWELYDTFTRDCVVDWAKSVNKKIVQKMDY